MTSLYCCAQLPVSNITSNLRQKIFKIQADSLKIDTISIVPSTFSIAYVPAADYRLDFVKATLHWKKKPAADSVTVTYRVFPFQLNPVAQRMSFDSVMDNFYVIPFPGNNGSADERKGMFDFGTLKAREVLEDRSVLVIARMLY
jgi:hypothetical protein